MMAVWPVCSCPTSASPTLTSTSMSLRLEAMAKSVGVCSEAASVWPTLTSRLACAVATLAYSWFSLASISWRLARAWAILLASAAAWACCTPSVAFASSAAAFKLVGSNRARTYPLRTGEF
jgi:hypothetical protein